MCKRDGGLVLSLPTAAASVARLWCCQRPAAGTRNVFRQSSAVPTSVVRNTLEVEASQWADFSRILNLKSTISHHFG